MIEDIALAYIVTMTIIASLGWLYWVWPAYVRREVAIERIVHMSSWVHSAPTRSERWVTS